MVFMPMKLSEVDVADAEQYIQDENWVMEQKMDGSRVLVEWVHGQGFTWHGAATHAAAKQHFPALEEQLQSLFAHADVRRVILDGELMIRTGGYRLFDMPMLLHGPTYLAVSEDTPFWQRRETLELLHGTWHDSSEDIKPVRSMRHADGKRALWHAINASGVEGAVVKRLDGLYQPGIRSKDQLKLKLVKTADLVVLSTRRTFKPDGVTVHTGSAELGVFGPDVDSELRKVCAASLIGKDLTIREGDVVEAAYLYREPGGNLVQPRILRKRLDKKAWECTDEQFPVYSREEVSS